MSNIFVVSEDYPPLKVGQTIEQFLGLSNNVKYYRRIQVNEILDKTHIKAEILDKWNVNVGKDGLPVRYVTDYDLEDRLNEYTRSKNHETFGYSAYHYRSVMAGIVYFIKSVCWDISYIIRYRRLPGTYLNQWYNLIHSV